MIAEPASTLDDPLAIGERKGLLELAWLMTAVVALLAVAVPWYFQALDVDLRPIAWSLFAFTALSLVASRAAGSRLKPSMALRSTIGLHSLGTLVLALIWHLAGGTANPTFLVLFVLPVMASFLTARRTLPYLTASLAVMAVSLVALAESPALRWYLGRLGVPLAHRLDWLGGWLERDGAGALGGSTPPALVFVVLVVFALTLLSVAFIGESLTSLLVILYRRLARSSVAREDAEHLSNKLLKGSPDPALVVYSDSGRIVQASDSFARDLLLEHEGVVGSSLFEVVEFSYPDIVRGALGGGEVPFVVYRVHDELRVGRLNAWSIRHADTDYSCVTLRDVTDVYYLQAALDSVEDPHLILDEEDRVVYSNRAASVLFGALETGADASDELSRRASPEGWWRLGLRQLHDRRVEVSQRAFTVSLSGTRLPGESERLTVVRMRRDSVE